MIMRLLLILISCLFLLPTGAGAVTYSFSDYYIDMAIEDDGGLVEEISFTIKNEGEETISWVEYTLISAPENLVVSDDIGSLSYSIENQRNILIRLRKPMMKGDEENIAMGFSMPGVVTQYEDKSILTLSYIPEVDISNFKFTVRLPPGSTLASEVEKTGESISAVYPVPSRIYSDGKRIIVEWSREELSAHEDFRIFLMYTTIDLNGGLPLTAGIVVGIIIGVSAAFYYYRTRPVKGGEIAGLVLEEDEKKIYDLLISGDNEILQDDIAKSTDFSRSKISKLVRRLEEKGIIKKVPYRKTNRLLLKKEFGGRH